MLDKNAPNAFPRINRGYNQTFRKNTLTLGVVVPVENYSSSAIPTMHRHLERIQMVEALGFSAVWLRDVPFNVPTFGDAGQLFDPFVYLGLLAGQTSSIALGVASIVLPIRHPAHVAKAAASVDVLSQGRLILGIASGDRPEEYPALNIAFEQRGEMFRNSFDYIRAMQESEPAFGNAFGVTGNGMDMLPKPMQAKLPLLITGGSQQDPDWIARNGDGWMTYPRNPAHQAPIIQAWRENSVRAGLPEKPVMQPLYYDLKERHDAQPQSIHLGFSSGVDYLLNHLHTLRDIGVNHVALNLRFNRLDIEQTLTRLSEDVLPAFST